MRSEACRLVLLKKEKRKKKKEKRKKKERVTSDGILINKYHKKLKSSVLCATNNHR